MRLFLPKILSVSMVMLTIFSCKQRIEERTDEVYSRHLREHMKLTILNTPLPDKKADLNLLILNDGQDLGKWGVKEILDSLYQQKAIAPVLIVGVHNADRMQQYGVSGIPDFQKNGSRADKYAAFINNELYDFVKKKAGVRKFRTVTIAGCSMGALSAVDIAWDHADRINQVGAFSGSFWWRDKDLTAPDYSDEKNRILLNKIRASRKKPTLKYWFYAGTDEEASDRDKDGIMDAADDTRDLVQVIKNKNLAPASDIVYKEATGGRHDYASWKKALPEFLIWAFAR